MRSVKFNLIDGQAFPFSFDLFFWSGYGNALWYLPFLVLANAFSTAVGGLTCGRKSASLIVVLTLSVVVGFMCLSKVYWTYPVCNYGLSISRKALPSVLLAIIIYKCWGNLNSYFANKGIFFLTSLSVFILSGFGIMYYHRNVVGWEIAMGVSFVGVFLSLSSLKWPVLNKNLSLWIYLAHAPLMQAGKDILPLLGLSWPKSIIPEISALTAIILGLISMFRFINSFGFTRRILLQAK